MYGGILIVVLISLVVLSPVIWFAWWTLADLGELQNRRPHAV